MIYHSAFRNGLEHTAICTKKWEKPYNSFYSVNNYHYVEIEYSIKGNLYNVRTEVPIIVYNSIIIGKSFSIIVNEAYPKHWTLNFNEEYTNFE